MAALNGEVKAFIVQALACFDTPTQVAEQVKKDYGIEVSRQQVESHDPTKYAGRGLAKKWAELFHHCRQQFREQTADIAIANRAYRLRALGRFVEKAEGMRNISLAMQALEQAAKECGDRYVNRQARAETPPDDVPPSSVEVTIVDASARKPDDADA
ncbi:hypothetical protein PSm6_44540 [Pseudomonas solani]|uniref:DUF2280 domain-containing protein n=1 Tax=Pseudomonas solani TaxID=2731552 RepID=A0ABN6BWY2_9PSED|nr:DUF2280 domain-containing protein [Pseudomonas solani]BCD88047.1 hypothetical protein PSm6_44540 [Pseudomonas solani]